VERQLRNGDGPTFFTDGSCLAPTTPTIAMAAWAIVLSNVVEDEDKIRTVNQGVQIDNLSSSFSTVAVARCHGQQSVDRAELLAVTHLFEQWNRTRLVTDSDYVRKSVNAVLQTSDVTTLAMKPNADLLYRLFAALPNSDHQIIKVESHVLEGRIPKQNHEPFYILGNFVADQAAKQANRQLAPDLIKQWESELEQYTQDRLRLRDLYKLLLEVQPQRAKLEHNRQAARSQQMSMPDSYPKHKTLPQQLAEWSPEGTWQFNLHWPSNITWKSPWGEEVMSVAIQW